MPKIYRNIEVTLDRADEILKELLTEYHRSLRAKEVNDKTTQLIHDICEKLRSALDRTARRYWEIHIAPSLSEEDKAAALIYFPIAKDQSGLDSFLGRWRWKAVKSSHQPVYDFLLGLQPFKDNNNKWLDVLNDLAIQGKHIDLVPQKKTEAQRIVVERGSASVSWDPSAVTFGGGPGVSVFIAGAPIDPRTQRIVPTPGVTERIETWVSFIIEGHNVNAAGFCKESCAGTRAIVSEMSERFDLS